MIIAFNKPYNVLSQFTIECEGQETLAKFGFPKNVYPIGRLDADSEGLLLLSDESQVSNKLLNPKYGHIRTYWSQVEKIPEEKSLETLRKGILIKDFRTLPAKASILNPQPKISDRNPPIRFRKNIPTCWVEIELKEGKNRQVRRMTASIGYPTLRLIRIKIGNYSIIEIGTNSNLIWKIKPGEWKILEQKQVKELLIRN